MESIPLCGRIPSYTGNGKRGRNGRDGDCFTKIRASWPEIYLDGIGWIPVEVTPKYENVMGTPYYETQETAVSNSSSSDQSLENDDKKKQEKQQEQKKQEKEQTTEKKQKENSRNTAADSTESLKAKQRWKNGS